MFVRLYTEAGVLISVFIVNLKKRESYLPVEKKG